jgi:signal transduction histidine kinase
MLLLALLVYFLRDIQHRLRILMVNASTMLDLDAPGSTIGGFDELHTLELALNNARRSLKQTRDERNQLVDRISSSWNKQLESARSSLTDIGRDVGPRLDSEARNDLTNASRNIDQVVKLINDLLVIEQIEADTLKLNKQNTDLNAVIERSLSVVQSLADNKQIQLAVECVEPVHMDLDEDRIVQVMVNLLTNAIKFSPNGSAVKVDTQALADKVVVTVSDNGPGMDAETGRHIFDQFVRGSHSSQETGFGLGLTICKFIVEAHEGSITLETAPGAGCKFVILLLHHSHD